MPEPPPSTPDASAAPAGTPVAPSFLDPIPRHYVTDAPGVGGRIKVRPEDFLVDELPLYEPCGEGEHLYLGIEKREVSHSELMGTLCRHFDVPERAIGFAGMKDKRAVTRQAVSVHLPGAEAAVDLDHDRIQVLWSMRHRNKLRRGHLVGNRFSIRIRDVDALHAPRALAVVRCLEAVGVPCSFGGQRFGYRLNNQVIGAAILAEDWQAAADELLGASGSAFPEYQRERRELYDAGRLDEARRLWTPADRAELIVAKALAAGRSPRQALLAVGRTPLSFWLSALQSAIFNRVVDARIAAGTLDALEAGDLAWKHDSRGVFPVTEAELSDPEIAQRLRAIEISPSGPLWGETMMRAAGAVARREEEALVAFDLSVDALLASSRAPSGSRRPLRAPLRNAAVDAGVDEHGHFIRLAFDLPRGVYATVVLREVIKAEGREEGTEARRHGGT